MKGFGDGIIGANKLHDCRAKQELDTLLLW